MHRLGGSSTRAFTRRARDTAARHYSAAPSGGSGSSGGASGSASGATPVVGSPGWGLAGVAAVGAVALVGAGGAYAYFQNGASLGFEASLPKANQQSSSAPVPVEEVPEGLAKEARERESKREAALAAVQAALTAIAGPSPSLEAVEELKGALQVAEVEGAFSDDVLAARRRLEDIHQVGVAAANYRAASEALMIAIASRNVADGRQALETLSSSRQKLHSHGEATPAEEQGVSFDENVAKAQLDRIEQATTAHSLLTSERVALQDALDKSDLDSARRSMEEVVNAEQTLKELEEEFSFDQGLLAAALVKVGEMEKMEQEAALRLAALERLHAAVASRNGAQCVEALEEAQLVGLEPSPLMELANILSNPERITETLARKGADAVVALQKTHDLNVKDFAQAAETVAAGMTEEQLRDQAVELAGVILRNHMLRSRELEEQLCGMKEEMFQRSVQRTEEVRAKFVKEREAVETRAQNELREVCQDVTAENCAETRQALKEVGEAERAKFRKETLDHIDARVAQERQHLQNMIDGLQEPLVTITDLATSSQSLQHRASTSHSLAVALLELQGALADGRPIAAELKALRDVSKGEDVAFVAQLMDQLPAQTVDRSKSPVPTEPQLKSIFWEQLDELKAAALAPPGSDLLTHVAAGATTNLLASSYSLEADAGSPLPADSPSEVARRNLSALSRAAPLVEKGDLRGALKAMEALTGSCQEAAAAWIDEAKHALLVQQLVRAAQAKVRCLNAVLL